MRTNVKVQHSCSTQSRSLCKVAIVAPSVRTRLLLEQLSLLGSLPTAATAEAAHGERQAQHRCYHGNRKHYALQ